MENLYNILEVDETATKDDIKQSYRNKSKKHHPDKQGGDKDKFQEIQLAYKVLSNDDSRKRYDETGQTGKPDIHSAFAQYISQSMDEILKNPTDLNILELLKSGTKQNISNAEKNLADLINKESRLSKIIIKFKVKKGNDIIGNVLNANLKVLQQQINQNKDGIQTLKDFYDILNNYDYDFQPAFVGFQGAGNFNTIFNKFGT